MRRKFTGLSGLPKLWDVVKFHYFFAKRTNLELKVRQRLVGIEGYCRSPWVVSEGKGKHKSKISRKEQTTSVGERSALGGSTCVSMCGRSGSENVGLSNENIGENPMPRKPKVSFTRFVHGGLVRT